MNGIQVHRPVFLLVLLFSFLLFLTGAFSGDGGGKRSPQKSSALNGFLININNIRLPLDNQGVLGDFDPGSGAGGLYDGKIFLFSGGLILTGYTNSTLWANGVFSASRMQDYQPGPVGSDQNDPRNKVYVVRSMDIPFGDSWQEWKNAVALGADFYDGDGDGKYNPSDLNYDGKWNSNEDRPDLIGDLTAWCVYNDGVPRALRRLTSVSPQGIEIHQTVFGFASRENIGNMLFVRYRLINKGTVADLLDSVYFSVITDPDLGDYMDDLLGCDTTLDAGYVYNATADAQYGVNAPVFLASLLQGPAVYIPGVTFTDSNGNGIFDSGESPLTEAYNVKGLVKGIDTLRGAKNLPMTSFMQMMQLWGGDPGGMFVWDYRNWQKGLHYSGAPFDPCTWSFGTGTNDPDCINWNPKYLYSGDPVAGNGWRNKTPIDQRKMITTGTFPLHKNQPVDIVAAYIVGRSPVSSLLSVNTAKELAKAARSVFNKNFEGPAKPDELSVDVRTGNGFIDLTWNTSPLVTYRSLDTILGIDRRVQGFYVTAYRTNSEAALIPGVVNAKIISSYAVNNSIHDIYQTQQNGGLDIRFKRPEAEYLLDSTLHADPAQGRIRLRITADPFDGIPLIKGKEYFFALTTYTLNHKSIVNKQTTTYGPPGDYLDATGAAIDEYSTSIIRVVYDTDLYEPAPDIGKGNKTSGFATQGNVAYLVVNDEELTGDSYTVEFKSDTSLYHYSASYSLKNNRTGQYLITDSKFYNYDTNNYAGKITEGFVLKVKPVVPAPSNETQQKYIPALNTWFTDLNVTNASLGAVYAGDDIHWWGSAIFGSRQSTITKANRLRAVEVRFGLPGKAYRYMNGFVGNNALARRNVYRYAAGIQPIDTLSSRGGSMGLYGAGYVDVPFQVWVKDSVYGEERQLAVGFVEKTAKFFGGNPDGNWYPGVDVSLSLEAIIVFDADYDPAGSQIEYTGGVFGSDSAWADLRGYQFPPGATTVTDEQKRIAASPLFNAMYVIGLSALTPTSTFTPGDIFRVPVAVYPYTDDDVYTFSTRKGGDLTFEEKMELFEKVNVFPNPFFANNTRFSYENLKTAEESFVTFTNLPETVTIKIYTVSGALIKTLTESDKMDGASSPFLRWDLKNQSGSRVASGMYLAIVTAPGYGEKLLKLGIIQQAGSK
ncbi:MAG: hypothetical protein L6Q47_12155 [Ignavibacteriaceae bacterium]|nr:hypothetical protein [Ignavibacteriaceae bacterium]